MYPLRFEPIFRRYLWGGKRLAEVLNKPIGDELCAESWEIVDHNQDQSIVKYGPWTGKTLHSLIQQFGNELLGDAVYRRICDPGIPAQLQHRFPLLLKFLDADRKLSVQVHPNDQLAATLSPPDFGKTEAWYVMYASPGSKIYAGLKQGVTREAFTQAVEQNRTEETLHSFEPHVGDCIFIQAGTVHAIGEGLLIAEIQQASDTTFRIFDWNRVDADGRTRQLHIDQGIQATDFERGPVNPAKAESSEFPNAKTMVSSDKFVMRRWELEKPTKIGGDGMFHILAVTRGEADLSGDPANQPLLMGDTTLIPASVKPVTVTPRTPTHVLEIFAGC